MTKIDRLGWADGMSFTSYGVRVGVRVDDRDVLHDVISRMPPGSKPARFEVVDHLYSLMAGGAKVGSSIRRLSLGYWNVLRISRSRSLNETLEAFESHVQLTVAEHARRRIFIHAGVVGWNDRAILIPGRSHSGKSTLVDRLVRAGATYYSDEYAVLDERGRVHPYPRPLSLRLPGSSDTRKISPEEIGAQIGSKPLRIGLVLSTRYRDQGHWRPRRLSQGKGVLELMANTVSARLQPELALTVLPKALSSAEILKGVRGEASEIVKSVLG